MWDDTTLIAILAILALVHGAVCAFWRYGLKRDLKKQSVLKWAGALIILFGIFVVATAAMNKTPSAGPTFRNWPEGLSVALLFLGLYLWFVRSMSPAAFAVGEIALGVASAVAVSADTRPDQFGITITYLVAVYLFAQGLHDLNHALGGRLTAWVSKQANVP